MVKREIGSVYCIGCVGWDWFGWMDECCGMCLKCVGVMLGVGCGWFFVWMLVVVYVFV